MQVHPEPTLSGNHLTWMPKRRGSLNAWMRDDNNGNIELPTLVIADVAIIFVFILARALSNILSSPDFPGWLAPIQVNTDGLSANLGLANACAALWVGASALVGGYTVAVNGDGKRALVAATKAAGAFLILCFLIGGANLPPFAPLSVQQGSAICVLAAALIAWRWSYGSTT